MKKHPKSTAALVKLASEAIPDYEYYYGDPVCTPVHWDDRGWFIPADQVGQAIEAVRAIPQKFADESKMMDRQDEAWKTSPDPIEVFSAWGWGAGPTRRRSIDPVFIAGCYGDFLYPACFAVFTAIAPFVNDTQTVFSAGRGFDRLNPSFKIGVDNGKLWFDADVTVTVEYD